MTCSSLSLSSLCSFRKSKRGRDFENSSLLNEFLNNQNIIQEFINNQLTLETFKTTDEYSVAVDNIVDRKKMKYERRQARLKSRRGIGDDEEDEEGEGGGRGG